MGEYVTISAKIPRELREKLARMGLKPSRIIRDAIEREVEEQTRRILHQKVVAASPIIRKVGYEAWIRSIRQIRDET